MKRKNIVGLIAIVAIIAMTVLAGCVEEEEVPTSTVTLTPILTGPNQYTSGDVLVKERTEKDCVFILDYNKTTDEYDVTMIHRNGNENGWYFEEDDYVSQMARERIDDLSPMVIAHIEDILTIPIVTSTSTPLSEPKYIPGDIVEEEKPITEIARQIVIGYDKTTDEYEINTIFLNRDRTWGHFVNDDTIWHDREWFEGYCPILIAHVDLSTITIGEPKISPTPTPTSKPKKWHSVTSFSGSADKTTQPFTIKGDEWQVKYEMKSSKPEYAVFGVFVYPRGETVMFVSSWDCFQQECSDTQYIYKGAGDYYFEITAANIDSWRLEVEDYY